MTREFKGLLTNFLIDFIIKNIPHTSFQYDNMDYKIKNKHFDILK
jgi:hypothetical protein